MHTPCCFTLLRSRKHAVAGGFALIVALTLMAFIMLLLVSMSMYIRVETETGTHQWKQTEARLNALLGLQVALGNLQELAGPDDRVTANADIISAVAEAAEASPAQKKGNRYWTAVWEGDTGAFKGYLISGQGASPDINAARDFSANFSLSGQLNDSSLARLVGAASASDSFIAAPKVAIGAVSGASTGNYAWWVGDLGTRAQLRQEVIAPALHPEGSEAALFAATNGSYKLFDLINSEAFGKVLMPAQIDLALAAAGVMEPAAKRKALFYDVTPASEGLLTNTRSGGLQKNLNAAFEDQMSKLISHHGSDQVFGPQRSAGDDFGGPKWTQLQSHYKLPETMSGSGFNASVAPRKMSDDEGAIAPVLLHFQLWIHGSLIDEGADTYRGRLLVFPLVAFWNPYDTTISGRTYYLRWMKDFPDVYFIINYDDYQGNPQSFTTANPTHVDFAFRLDVPELSPGQTVVLTPDTNAYWNADPLPPLTPGDRDTYIYIDSAETFPMTAGWTNLEMTLTGADNSNFAGIGIGYDPTSLFHSNGRLDDFIFFLQDIPIWGHKNVTDSAVSNLRFAPAAPYPQGISPLPEADVVLFDADGNAQGPTFGFIATLRQPELVAVNAFNWRNIRWLANFNPRAAHTGRSPQDFQRNGQGGFNTTASYIGATTYDSNAYASDFRSFNVGLSPMAPPAKTVLFSLPRKKEHLTSIGDLRHANLSMKGVGTILQSEAHANMVLDNNRPAYMIGESLADPRLLLGQTVREDWPMARYPKGSGNAEALRNSAVYYDWSYLLNEALFDDYFFSTATADWLAKVKDEWAPGAPLPVLPNSRLKLRSPAADATPSAEEWATRLGDFDAAAENLYVDGAFNVNSTSVNAWAAQLASFLDVAVTTGNSGTVNANNTDSLLTRTLYPLLGAYAANPTDSDSSAEAYAGLRRLSEAQIRDLAEAIVDQVRARGPFTSMANFVNRSPDATEAEHRLKGALQAAIDASGINSSLEGSARMLTAASYPNNPTAAEWFTDYTREALAGSKLYGIPGYLTQGDILARLGPVLRPRSDTFVIRAYGDVTGTSGTVEASAVCEATVQRTTAPLDPAALEPHGRQYRIVSFRWLPQDDI